MRLSHLLHLNVLGSLACLMDIVFVLNSPLMSLSLSGISDLGGTDEESDVVGLSVSSDSFPTS